MAEENTNIFISDLPAEMDDETLKTIFSAYGTVTWSKVMQSKGKPTTTAIVEFGDIAEAKWCVENLDGNIAEGLSSPIQVKFKIDNRGKGKGKDGKGKNAGGFGKSWAPAGGKDGGSKGWSPTPPKGAPKGFTPYEGGKKGGAETPAAENTNIFISDLPAEMDDETLKTIFSDYGTVTWSKVMKGKGKPTSTAIVEFGDIAEAKWCVENLDGNIVGALTDPIQVKFKSDRGKGAGKDGKGKNAGGFGGGKAAGGGGWQNSAPAGGGKVGGGGWQNSAPSGGGKVGGGKGPINLTQQWAPAGGKGSTPYEGGKSAAPPGENTNVYISDLPAEMDDETLKGIFGAYGTVTWSKVMPNKGGPTANAIVEFGDIAEAKWVVENLDGNIAEGLSSPIQVKFKIDNRGKGKGKNGKGKNGGGWGKS